MPPTTRYAKHGELDLAYQVFGEGDVDIVIVPSFVSHIDFHWADPAVKAWLEKLSSFARVVVFDKAGTGGSDPVSTVPTLEERAAEIEAVMDAAQVERAALFGLSEGGPSSIFFTATRNERVSALVLFGTFPLGAPYLTDTADEVREGFRRRGIDDRYLPTDAQVERLIEFRRCVEECWGEGKALKLLVPSWPKPHLAMIERLAASPGMARATLQSGARLDVVDLLPTIEVPALVVHATHDLMPVQLGRAIAELMPNARLLELEGDDHAPWLSQPDAIVTEVQSFLTGTRPHLHTDRALATVLFTDIVSSTARAAELGDSRWRSILERHDQVTRSKVATGGGRVVKSTGDGALATFDGPAAAIRCARTLIDSLAEREIPIRAGIHTGECELIGDDVGGLAVHIAARVNALAEPGEILVSRTVRDLVVGSGIRFRERGVHELTGVPGAWELLAVAPAGAPETQPELEVAAMPTPPARESMRPGDRMALAVARRAPGLARRANRFAAKRLR